MATATAAPEASKVTWSGGHERPGLRPVGIAVVNILVFALFALSFVRPQAARDWRSFSAFLVAYFVEM